MLQRRHPSVRFSITLAARCFLRRIRGNIHWKSAHIVTTFCREIAQKHKNLYAMKKAVRAVVNFQRFWRRCNLKKEARIAVLTKKWLKEEEGVIMQAQRAIEPAPVQCLTLPPD